MRSLRVVHVGCGKISNAWFKAVKQRADIEVVGLVDINRAAAEERKAAHELHGAEIGTGLDSMLGRLKPDFVFDCTIPEVHDKVTTTALKHGCHVLGEKPLADTMPKAMRVVAASEKAGRTYAVMQNRRYISALAALRRFLESGAIGRLTTAHCDFLMGCHPGGFREEMRHVLLLDMAIHTFDTARYLTGQDPAWVLGHEWNPPGSWYAHDASAIAVFEMTNQVVYSYRGSWCAEGLRTSWQANWRIIGEKGSVTWDGEKAFHAQVITSQEGTFRQVEDIPVPCDPTPGTLEGHAACIDEFVRCHRSGERPQTICSDNIKSLAMVHAAIQSAAKGRKVKCSWQKEPASSNRQRKVKSDE